MTYSQWKKSRKGSNRARNYKIWREGRKENIKNCGSLKKYQRTEKRKKHKKYNYRATCLSSTSFKKFTRIIEETFTKKIERKLNKEHVEFRENRQSGESVSEK